MSERCLTENLVQDQLHVESVQDQNISHLSLARDEICSLTIRRVQAEHNGPWLCIAEDDDEDEDQQYVFLDVKNAGSKLEVGWLVT